jgi:hypothetical protein
VTLATPFTAWNEPSWQAVCPFVNLVFALTLDGGPANNLPTTHYRHVVDEADEE